jgi:hypothetical protein
MANDNLAARVSALRSHIRDTGGSRMRFSRRSVGFARRGSLPARSRRRGFKRLLRARRLQRADLALDVRFDRAAVDARQKRRRTGDLCRSAVSESDRDLVFAEHRVTSAVGAVMASAAGKLVAEAEARRAAFFGSVSVLRFLRSSLSDIHRQRVDQVLAYPTDFDIGEDPARAAWRSAAEALSRDADAELPK